MRIRDIAANLLNVFIGAVEVILGLRFALKLLGANASSDFVNWIYEMSGVLLDPFRGIFPARVFENRFVLEFSTLFAMLVYALIGMLMLWVMSALTPSTPVVVKKTRR
jgi:uncharacterized protein YggT (Ycf19 family)